MRFRLRTLMIVLAVAIPASAAIWFIADSALEVVGWAALPILFALAYWRLRKAQATTRGYAYSGGDSGTGGEGGV